MAANHVSDFVVAFLRQTLPRLGMRWAGYRKVRRQVWDRVIEKLSGAPEYGQLTAPERDGTATLIASVVAVKLADMCLDRPTDPVIDAAYEAIMQGYLPVNARATSSTSRWV